MTAFRPVTMRLGAVALAAMACLPPFITPANAADTQPSLVARQDLALHGKTILFTTPRNYAGKLGGLLIEQGAQPIWMPVIVIEPMADYGEFDLALIDRNQYEWIAFTSRNGIEAFFSRLKALGLDAADFADVKFAAIGNDARALEVGGIEPDLVPAVSSPRGIADELARRGVTQGAVLVPVPDVIGMEEPRVVPDFLADLQEIGLKTIRVPAYVTARATDGLAVGTNLLLTGKIDMIAFTSRGEIESLLLHLGDRRDVLDGDTAIACFGPITAAGARMRKLRLDVIAEDYSRFEGFVAAMAHYYSDRGDD